MIKIYNGTAYGWISNICTDNADFTDNIAEASASLVDTARGRHQVANAAARLPHIHVINGDAAGLYADAETNAEQCVAYAKAWRMQQWDVPVLGTRHHAGLIVGRFDGVGRVPSKPVVPWLEYIQMPKLAKAIELGKLLIGSPQHARSIPVTFRGTVAYTKEPTLTDALLVAHRRPISDRFGGAGRTLAVGDYYKELRNSDVTISPWGYGEACWRDWEGLLCGCAVIKPACPWVLSASGLYQSDRLIWCKHDWSDIDDAIDRAKSMPHAARQDNIKWAIAESRRGPEIVTDAVQPLLSL